ncbi:MAG: class F sortase, partial [Candidatus Dormibacteraeota bacterium]|nr:class F sortase [Candidatus Dormibacteraeota bacterium]
CLWFGSPVESGRLHPTKIDIDSINVHAPVSGVGLNQSYQVAIPPFDKPGQTAWYQNSAVPGGQGSAMITGHVDTNAGPAVFKNLNKMKQGDMIKVTLSDNSQVTFQTDRVALYPKSNFPSERVYGASDVPALNLVTCAGTYNQSAGGYLSNLVVYTHKVS